MCGGCEDRAIEAASRDEHERRKQDQVVPEQKAGGWFSHFRT
ncbi:hypothetical protein [Streptomyces sp. NPDC002550]